MRSRWAWSTSRWPPSTRTGPGCAWSGAWRTGAKAALLGLPRIRGTGGAAGAGVRTARRQRTCSRDQPWLASSFVSLIDLGNNTVEYLAYADDLGNWGCPKFPRKPDRPRKWDTWDWRDDSCDGRDRCGGWRTAFPLMTGSRV